MPKLSDMPPPGTLTGLELIPMLQGGGVDGNVGVPLLVYNPAFGGSVLALRVPMVADLSATIEADPGAAGVRWNNADPDSAGELYINDADGDSGDLAAVFASLTVGGFIYLQGATNSAARDNLQRWQVTSKSDESGYTKLGVSLQASSGAFSDDDALELIIQQPAPSPGVDRNVVTTVSSSSGTTTCDASLGDYFKTTLGENTTLALSNVPAACTLHIQATQGASAYTLGFPAGWNWGAGNSAPTMPEGPGAILDLIVTTNDSGATGIVSARVRA